MFVQNFAAKPEFTKLKTDLQHWRPKHNEPRNLNSPHVKGVDD
jgi:hypothetical protein